MNRWNITEWLEAEVTDRDGSCVYCGIVFCSSDRHGSRPSWEHIVNDAKIIFRENIALCFRSRNSSKGARLRAEWFNALYCKQRAISREIVRAALQNLK
jgi:hypothetical protein